MYNLIDRLTSGILVVDEDLKIFEWNNWLTIHAEITKEQAIGKKLDELFEYIHKPTLMRRIKTALMLDTQTFYTAQDGYLIRIKNEKITDSYFEYMRQSIKLIPIEDKKVLIIINDHTEIDETMHKVEETSKRAMNYLGVIDRYVYTVSLDKFGYITDASSAFCRFNETTKKDIIGKSWLQFFAPDMGIETISQFNRAMQKNDVCFSGEVKMRLLNKKVCWFKLSLFGYNSDGEHFQAILEDITDKKRVEELSVTDELTKLFNRRHFNTIFPKELGRAKREKKIFSLMVMDVDNFKLYNDTYGHQQGDYALKAVSTVLKDTLKRGGDYVFRLGGEEFGAIISTETMDSILHIGEYVRSSVEKLKIEHKRNSNYGVLTASIGISTIDFSKDGCDKDICMNQIYKNSDEALYAAKDGGRNRVEMFPKINMDGTSYII